MALVRRSGTSTRPDRPDRAALMRELTALDPDRRRRAAQDLEGDAEAVPALLDRVALEPQPVVREALLTTLAGHDTPAVARALATHLASDDASLRVAIAGALGTMTASVPPLMPELMTSADHDVRIMAAMVLADLSVPEAPEWLARMIATDEHPNVVAAALDAFLPSATRDHLELLEDARDRFPGDPFLRYTVAMAVPRLLLITGR